MGRVTTNTLLQARWSRSTGPQFVEAARNLAEKTIQQAGKTTEERIEFMAMKVVCRPLKAAEVKIVQKTFNGLHAYYQTHEADARKLIAVGETKADPTLEPAMLASWTMVANQLFNLG